MTSPRIEPLPVSEMKPDWTEILDRLPGEGLKGQHAPVNVLGTLMRQPQLVGDFLNYWVQTKVTAKLSTREQELIILRMAVHYRSDYVWGHHIPPGREAGILREEKLRLLVDGPVSGFEGREAVLLEAIDRLVLGRQVDDDTYTALTAYFDQDELVEFLHLYSQYVLFAVVNNTFRVELEDGINPIPWDEAVG